MNAFECCLIHDGFEFHIIAECAIDSDDTGATWVEVDVVYVDGLSDYLSTERIREMVAEAYLAYNDDPRYYDE